MRNFSSLFRSATGRFRRWIRREWSPGPQIDFSEADRKFGTEPPFLASLSDGLEEQLHLMLTPSKVGAFGEGKPSRDEEPNETLRRILATARPMEADEDTICEIIFEDYLLYQIRNESYTSGDPDEVRCGRWLSVCERSKLLSDIGRYTDAQQLADGSCYPDQWKHYQIITQRHIVDVVAICEPIVRVWCR